MARFYEEIIGCRNEGIYRVVTILGIKFKRKNARVQTLAEIKKLSAQCANLAGSVRALSEFAKRSHETTNALLSERLGELRSQLESLDKVSEQHHRETTRKLDDASSVLKSHIAMLTELRAAQEEANRFQGQNHQAMAQKLDEAHSLLKAHTEKLAEFRAAQEETNRLQGQNHQATTQKLDEAHNLLKTHGEKLAEFRAVQEEANRLQGQNHQATTRKLDEASNLLKTHAEKLAEFRAAQEEANRFQGQNHQATAQKLDEAHNLLKTHGEKLEEFRSVQEETNRLQGQSHQATTQKLDEAHNILKSHAEKLAEFRAAQEEANKVQGQNHQATVQKLDEANNLLKSHTGMLTEFRAMQEAGNKLQGKNHQETVQKLDEATKLVKTDVGRTGSLLELEYSSTRYYQNSFEKGFLTPMFEYMNRSDFEEKYLALIRGMTPPSIREVNKILSRVSRVKAKPDQTRYNFYSVSEQDEKTKLRSDFENQILRISDNLYAYDKYLLPIRHFEICVFLYKHGIELVRDKENVRKKDMIDAGGFIGDSVLVLSDYTDKNIYSFEANPQNFDLLKKTLEINHLSKVIPVQKALWSSETELEMHVQGSCSSFTEVGGIQYVNGTVRVPTVTLDNFVSENKLDVGLIKIDLEGAELEFLRGAEHTIRIQKPVLLLSIYHKPSDFFELKPLLEQWVPEYEFSVFNPVDQGILLETMIVAQPKSVL